MEILVMVLHKEHVLMASFVTPMEHVNRVQYIKYLFIATFSVRDYYYYYYYYYYHRHRELQDYHFQLCQLLQVSTCQVGLCYLPDGSPLRRGTSH